MNKLNVMSLIGKRVTYTDSWYGEYYSFVIDLILVDKFGDLFLGCNDNDFYLSVDGKILYSLIADGLYIDEHIVDHCVVTKTYKII